MSDELSNTAEELRAERDQLQQDREITRKSRLKNERRFKIYASED